MAVAVALIFCLQTDLYTSTSGLAADILDLSLQFTSDSIRIQHPRVVNNNNNNILVG